MNEVIKFKKSLRGYNPGAVDRFIAQLTGEYNNGCNQNTLLESDRRRHLSLINAQTNQIAELESSYKRLECENAALKESLNSGSSISAQNKAAGQALIDAMVEAELFASAKTAAANAEAEQIIGKAKREADQIIQTAAAELSKADAKREEIIKTLKNSLEFMSPKRTSGLAETASIAEITDTMDVDATALMNANEFTNVLEK